MLCPSSHFWAFCCHHQGDQCGKKMPKSAENQLPWESNFYTSTFDHLYRFDLLINQCQIHILRNSHFITLLLLFIGRQLIIVFIITWYSAFKLSGCIADTVRPIISGKMTVTMGAGTHDYNCWVELHWHLSFHKFDVKNFSDWKRNIILLTRRAIFRVYRIIAWPICNQCLNLLDKMLMSVCAQVFKFDSSVSCKQNKFQQKIHSKWKMWMINFINRDMQKILMYAYDIVLFRPWQNNCLVPVTYGS